MLIELWPGNWYNQLESMEIKMNEGNESPIEKLRIRKVWIFSRNDIWKNIGCIVQAPKLFFWLTKLWYKEEDIYLNGKKKYIVDIWMNIVLYETCSYYVLCVHLIL